MAIKYKHLLFFLLSIPVFVSAQTSEQSLNTHWQFRKKGDVKWISATVPGTVHTDLLTNKLIPDPFFGTNEQRLQWIENEDWEYENSFTVNAATLQKEDIELQFEGLDTYADVYINNKLIITANNMFRTWNADVKSLLRPGQNSIFIVFHSAVKKGKEEAKKLAYTLPGDEKVFTRKAQYQYGWDFGPRFVTCGIWKNVKLICHDKAKIENITYTQKTLSDSIARLEFKCEIVSMGDADLGLSAGTLASTKSTKIHLVKGRNICTIAYTINNPKRWWSNGLGEAYLYHFIINLSEGKTVIDNKKLDIGLRTIELVQDKDSAGFSFYFKLNGKPVFMKGANYIPPDNFLPRVSKVRYAGIVSDAVTANMNMLRVWGGGVYPDDEFYEQCDKKGILIWQDLMFACAMYPGDTAFINNVKQEVAEQFDRLQSHASIALWCGNNEIDEGWQNWDWQKQYKYSKRDSAKIWTGYLKLFQEAIPDIIYKDVLSNLQFDSTRIFPTQAQQTIYWPSSPSIGWGHKESLLQGDSHYWGVWWGLEPFENYKLKTGRFVSEYGFQAMPDINILKTITDTLSLESAAIKNHQKHPTGYETIKTYMERDYKVPAKFEDLAYVSQLLQAEGMKTAIEAHRRAKPYCMGSLYWQLNDCWPGTSWSSIDYSGSWKASQYQAKHSFKDVLVSVNEEKDSVMIFVVSDKLKDLQGKLKIEIMDFSGLVSFTKTIDIKPLANSSKCYFKISSKIAGRDKKVLITGFTINNQIYNSYFYFAKPKDLKLSKPTIKIKPISSHSFELTSNVLTKDLCIKINGKNVTLSDNYFDLLPNEKKTITVPSKTLSTKDKITVMSLFDTL